MIMIAFINLMQDVDLGQASTRIDEQCVEDCVSLRNVFEDDVKVVIERTNVLLDQPPAHLSLGVTSPRVPFIRFSLFALLILVLGYFYFILRGNSL